jgi:hypothetical protein
LDETAEPFAFEPATTIPTKRGERVRLEGPPGTPRLLEFVELRVAGGESFGQIEIRSEGNEISVQEMASGQVTEYQPAAPHRTLTVTVSETSIAVELDDSDVMVVRRTKSQPVRSIKG